MSNLVQDIVKWENNFGDFKKNLRELFEETKGDSYFAEDVVKDKKYADKVNELIITPLVTLFEEMDVQKSGSGIFEQNNENVQLRCIDLHKAKDFICDQVYWSALLEKHIEAQSEAKDGFVSVSPGEINYRSYKTFVNDLHNSEEFQALLKKITEEQKLTQERLGHVGIDMPEQDQVGGENNSGDSSNSRGSAQVDNLGDLKNTDSKDSNCLEYLKRLGPKLCDCTPFRLCLTRLSAKWAEARASNEKGIELKDK